MAYLALMLHYFLSICFEINIFNKVLFLYVVAEHIEKSCNILLFINDYFRDLPFVVLSLLRLGDVEINPGPKKLSVIKFYHWNVNGLAAYGFLKVPLIETFITTDNCDVICFLETVLDSTVFKLYENIAATHY